MAPNKFEKHIKQRLQEREIEPSAEAWNRISEKLEVAELPKSRRFYSFAIAAGFIGFLMVSFWYLNTDALLVAPQTIVKETPVNTDEKKQNPESVLEEKIGDDEIVLREKTKPKSTISPVLPEKEDEVEKNPVTTVKKSELLEEKVGIALQVPDKLIYSKIEEIVAQVDLLERSNSSVTDEEINVLLRQAQKEIVESQIFSEDGSVDASALLADVEDELDNSFRDQIFDALKDGFVKVRIAVADRNK